MKKTVEDMQKRRKKHEQLVRENNYDHFLIVIIM